MHRVRLSEDQAAPALSRLAPETKRRVKHALAKLAADPYPDPQEPLQVRQLELAPGREPVYRLRVGDWRVVYVVRGALVLVVRIMHRSDGYCWLE